MKSLCTHCNKVKILEKDFRKHPGRERSYNGRCKQCEADAIYYRRYKDRLTREEFDNPKCFNCGGPVGKLKFVKNKLWCFECRLEKKNRKQAKRTKSNYEAHVYKKYGLTLLEYKRMKKICEVCGSLHRLCIDHNHDSGESRGILCSKCNSGLGFFNDDMALLKAAVTYLKKYDEV